MAATKSQLVRDLAALGVPQGRIVMIHSSLSALGPVEGGAETVVDALLETVGERGTLLLPAFRDSVWDNFADFTNSDCDCTSSDGLCPSQQPGFQGVIPEAVRGRPGSLRSCHPTHSWVALGVLARHILAGHRRSLTPCGVGNPFEAMEPEDCVLLLGVGVDRVTLWHYYEERLRVPYVGHYWPKERHLNHTVPGKRLQYEYPGILQDISRAAGILRVGPVGKSDSGLMKVGEFKMFMEAVIADDPYCMVLRPPDRNSGDLAVDALRKAEGMLKAWRKGFVGQVAPFDRPFERVDPQQNGKVVRTDCPAFAGFHEGGGQVVSLCSANGKHPDFFRLGGVFNDHGLTTCDDCWWHQRFPLPDSDALTNKRQVS